jgi:hypothetical protein
MSELALAFVSVVEVKRFCLKFLATNSGAGSLVGGGAHDLTIGVGISSSSLRSPERKIRVPFPLVPRWVGKYNIM